MSELILVSPADLRAMIYETVTDAIKSGEEKVAHPQSELPELLTRVETAQYLGVCLSKIDQLSREGRLRKYRNNRIVRFKRDEVINFFQNTTKS